MQILHQVTSICDQVDVFRRQFGGSGSQKVSHHSQVRNPSLRITNIQNSVCNKAYQNNNYVQAKPLVGRTGEINLFGLTQAGLY